MVAAAAVLSIPAFAQLNPGEIDKDYAPKFNGNIFSMVLQENGKHMYAGAFTKVGSRQITGIARLNDDGTPDETFNAGGTGFDNYATAMAQTPDGKFIVAGTFGKYNGTPVGALVRINADGTLDETFKSDNEFSLEGSSFTTEMQLQHIAMLPDGKFYVAGGFNRVNGKHAPLIARFNADGTRDESFVPTEEEIHLKTSPYVDAFYMDADGSIYLGGAFGAYGGNFNNKRMVRIAPDGKLDAAFQQPGFDGYVKSIAPFGSDALLVGGDFVEAGSKECFLTCVVNKDGSLNNDYNSFVYAFTDYPGDESLAVFSAQLVGENVIVVGGDVVVPTNSFVYALEKDGSKKSSEYTINAAPNSIVTYMKVDEKSGFIYVSGLFTQLNSSPMPYFARIAVPKNATSAIQDVANEGGRFAASYDKGNWKFGCGEKPAEVSIVDIMGRTVFAGKSLSSASLTWPVADGMYVVVAKGVSGKTYTAKAVVKN